MSKDHFQNRQRPYSRRSQWEDMYDDYMDWQAENREEHRVADITTSAITIAGLVILYQITDWFPHDVVRVRDAQGHIPWDTADCLQAAVGGALLLLWGIKILFGSYERNQRHFI